MFSVLLTNVFSIVGTIMGIKYATQEGGKKKNKLFIEKKYYAT